MSFLQKPNYKFRKEDFIPVFGHVFYSFRNMSDSSRQVWKPDNSEDSPRVNFRI